MAATGCAAYRAFAGVTRRSTLLRETGKSAGDIMTIRLEGLTLFDNKAGSNTKRVRMYLAEKGLEIPRENVEFSKLEHRTPEFRKINPMAALPVLRLEDGSYLAESCAICRYLEEFHPNPPLFGTTPKERANSRNAASANATSPTVGDCCRADSQRARTPSSSCTARPAGSGSDPAAVRVRAAAAAPVARSACPLGSPDEVDSPPCKLCRMEVPPRAARLSTAAAGPLAPDAAASDQVQRVITGAVSLIEPVMILGFGGVVGFVALALLQAIYGINASSF